MRQFLRLAICLDLNYFKQKKPMENFKITTRQIINAELELPQYFKVGDLNFIRVLNENLHLHVSKEDFRLELYPDIKLKPNRILYWFESHEWQEITEEEFFNVYYETLYLIQKFAEK